jgi:hypothetical protein
LVVSSGEVFSLTSAVFAPLRPEKMSVKEIIIVMALPIAFLSAVFVVVSAMRGEK